MTKSTNQNYLQTIFVGLAGFSIGVGIMLLGDNPAEFIKTPQFKVWLMLIGAQTALWSVLALPLWRALKPFGGIKRNVAQFSLLIFALLLLTLIIIFIGHNERPLAYHRVKIGVLHTIGMTTALLAIHGIGLIYRKLDTVRSKIESAEIKAQEESVKLLLDFKHQLEQFLLAAGMIIGAATLVTGALRPALVAYKGENNVGFPKEFILLYGLVYSMFLALVYLPTHVKLQNIGKELRDKLTPLPKNEKESWAGWYSNRKVLDDLLQLQSNPIAHLFSGISILSPLAGSLIALVIGR